MTLLDALTWFNSSTNQSIRHEPLAMQPIWCQKPPKSVNMNDNDGIYTCDSRVVSAENRADLVETCHAFMLNPSFNGSCSKRRHGGYADKELIRGAAWPSEAAARVLDELTDNCCNEPCTCIGKVSKAMPSE